jgi:DNA mismatch repair protein MutS
MAGKSTYMRQVALITVMAQIGSFVPAREATLGIVDKVFTRVGASDDLASGQSTFMLEMNEVAYILRNATKQSLIIYDEVGRGTSTFDGMSIARAIVEYTNSKKIGAKTLFATHYHELTVMEDEFDGIVNYNIAAKKRGDGIVFLRKIVRGSTDDSYGIEVAKLSGLPNEVIKRAREVLATVEASAVNLSTSGDKVKTPAKPAEDDMALSLQDCINEQVIEELKAADLNTLSPLEAMNLLFGLQRRLKNG